MKLPPFKLVTKPFEWSECLDRLRVEPRLAIDLEANSMFAYRESVCLIQISTPSQDYIVDPTCDLDLDGLGQLIADPDIEKIFHAAEYDLILLKRQYGWELNNLFDTMWGARILGYKRFGLASLLEQFYDIRLNKRYQKSNWCQRPLAPEQLTYAQHDTHFLFQLRDRLSQELREAGCEEEAAEAFAEQTRIKLNDNSFDPDSFWSINGVRDLSRQQQAILKALSIYRDQEARRRDQPLFKIFNERTMVELARQAPSNMDELARVHGMTRGQIRRYGRALLRVIGNGKKARPPAFPRRQHRRRPDEVVARYDRLQQWRKKRAQSRGVESDVIVSRVALWEIASTNPQNGDELEQLDSIGSWRYSTYGEEILRVLKESS
jgi:ribonuclease D